MLNRKCQKGIGGIARVGDFNVRQTIVLKQPRGTMQSIIDSTWRELLRDCIGGGIINDSKNQYSHSIQTELGIVSATCLGSEIIDKIWPAAKDQDFVRINITKLPIETNKERSWIIVRT